jgi:hypothetical protein
MRKDHGNGSARRARNTGFRACARDRRGRLPACRCTPAIQGGLEARQPFPGTGSEACVPPSRAVVAALSNNRTGMDSMPAAHRSAVLEARSIHPEARSIHPEARSIHPEVRSIVADARSIHTDGHLGHPAVRSAVSDGRSIHPAVHSANPERDSGVPDARSGDATTHSAAGNFHQTSPAPHQTNPRT